MKYIWYALQFPLKLAYALFIGPILLVTGESYEDVRGYATKWFAIN